VFGEIREDFAVEINVGFFETGDEAVVWHAMQARGGADLDLPQPAKVTLLFAAALKGMHPGVLERFLGGAVLVFASPLKTLGVL